MNNLFSVFCFSFFFSFISTINSSPVFNEIEILTPVVEKFDKFEARIDMSASFDNPYDYDQVSILGYFTSPNGITDTIDGFYMRKYTLNEPLGNLFVGGTEFRIRYSPKEVGQYQVIFEARDTVGTNQSVAYDFISTEVSSENNNGFVRPTNTNYLKFDNDIQYIPIGENIAWDDNNVYQDYKNWLTNLADNGGNFFRLWHAQWGLGIEWSTGNGYQGLRQYKQPNCFYQDWLLDFCADKGIYVMLALQHHGTVSTNVNPHWNDNPYNIANGGPCQNTVDFFTNEEAKAHVKNRFRYVVARWGYSRNILCWELFNEVHWTDNFQANKHLVAEWHIEMAEYLKSIDTNNHLVTTSYGDDLEDEEVWNNENFDFTQSHIYNNATNLERVLANTSRRYLNEFQKPTLNGEFGLGISSSIANEDPDGIHIHNSIWGSLFGGSMGTAMTWWWESYIHPQDLYFRFLGISNTVDQIDFIGRELSPAKSLVLNAPDDLTVEPSLNWGAIATDSITVNEDGSLSPGNAQLSQFLYGSFWNTQYRSPPTFTVDNKQESMFSVIMGNQTGTSPGIGIWVDSVLVLYDSLAQVNMDYSVFVPEGQHTIHVDNKGTDWIVVDEYRFENLGSKVDAYVLKSSSNDYATGWVVNNDYNHKYISEFGTPEVTPEITIKVDDFVDGLYALRLIDPSDGSILSEGIPSTSENGTLEVSVPSFEWDVAFIIDDSPVSTTDIKEEFPFTIYPNPIGLGQLLNIKIDNLEPYDVSLFNTIGQSVFDKKNTYKREFIIPTNIQTGLYWIRISQGGKIGVTSIVIYNR